MSTPERPDRNPKPNRSTTTSGWGRLRAWMSSHKILTGIIAFVVLAMIAGSLAEAEVPPTGVAPQTSDATDATTSPPTGDPVAVEVPDVEGLDADRATEDLEGAGPVVSVERRYSRQAAGTVLKVTPSVGTDLAAGEQVTVVIARAYPKVPSVVGERSGPAAAELRDAGYEVNIRKGVSSEPAGTVIKVTPSAGTELLPVKTVTITVAKAAPEPSGGTCHPSYTGACLDPNASDYDCAGGPGDGPLYTGFVRVVGYDEYGLDADNDGYGCE